METNILFMASLKVNDLKTFSNSQLSLNQQIVPFNDKH